MNYENKSQSQDRYITPYIYWISSKNIWVKLHIKDFICMTSQFSITLAKLFRVCFSVKKPHLCIHSKKSWRLFRQINICEKERKSTV